LQIPVQVPTCHSPDTVTQLMKMTLTVRTPVQHARLGLYSLSKDYSVIHTQLSCQDDRVQALRD